MSVRGGLLQVGGDDQEVLGDEMSHCDRPSLVETMTKGGVLVDVCKTCKGVWLDRGEVFFFSRSPRSSSGCWLRADARAGAVEAAIARGAG